MDRWLPEVLAERRAAGRIELTLHVPAHLECFAGHFPGAPILPGVVQIHWAIHYIRSCRTVGDVERLENVKFFTLVLPDTELELSLDFAAAGSTVAFAYTKRERRVSAGRIVFRDSK